MRMMDTAVRWSNMPAVIMICCLLAIPCKASINLPYSTSISIINSNKAPNHARWAKSEVFTQPKTSLRWTMQYQLHKECPRWGTMSEYKWKETFHESNVEWGTTRRVLFE
jgi:hypothetical protein